VSLCRALTCPDFNPDNNSDPDSEFLTWPEP